jgi:MGT family glycosyltransferase
MRPDLIRVCAEAFAARPWRVVIAVDDQPFPSVVPPNVSVVRRVPQLDLLPKVAAFVTHGGTNSVMEALHFGVPMVVLPEAPEHAITAARVEDLGLGRQFDPRSVTADALFSAVTEVAGSAAIAGRLAAMRAADLEAGGVVAAAAALRRFAASAQVPVVG